MPFLSVSVNHRPYRQKRTSRYCTEAATVARARRVGQHRRSLWCTPIPCRISRKPPGRHWKPTMRAFTGRRRALPLAGERRKQPVRSAISMIPASVRRLPAASARQALSCGSQFGGLSAPHAPVGRKPAPTRAGCWPVCWHISCWGIMAACLIMARKPPKGHWPGVFTERGRVD